MQVHMYDPGVPLITQLHKNAWCIALSVLDFKLYDLRERILENLHGGCCVRIIYEHSMYTGFVMDDI